MRAHNCQTLDFIVTLALNNFLISWDIDITNGKRGWGREAQSKIRTTIRSHTVLWHFIPSIQWPGYELFFPPTSVFCTRLLQASWHSYRMWRLEETEIYPFNPFLWAGWLRSWRGKWLTKFVPSHSTQLLAECLAYNRCSLNVTCFFRLAGQCQREKKCIYVNYFQKQTNTFTVLNSNDKAVIKNQHNLAPDSTGN